MTILLVEADPVLGRAIVTQLRVRYRVDWYRQFAQAELALATSTFLIGIFGASVADGLALALVSRLRDQQNALPIIVTADDMIPSQRIAFLAAGADDCLSRPFALEELMVRCEVVLRRLAGRSGPVITCGDLVYEPLSQRIMRAGRPIHLSATELKIFDILMSNQSRVISKQQIENRLYGWDDDVESNSVEVHMSRLRRKIGNTAIRTVHGIGYTMSQR